MSQKPDKWNGKSRGGYTGYMIFIFLIRRVGLRAAYILLGFVSFYFIPFAPKATRSMWYYYRRVLHRGWLRSFWSLWQHYYVFGQTIVDRVAVENGMGHKFKYEFENYDQTEAMFLRGECAVMIGAHFGAPSVGADFFGEYAHRMHMVMYDAEHRRVKEALNRFGQTLKLQIIPVGEDPLASVFDIKSALDKGDCVSFMGDRFLRGTRTFTADFLGQQARFPMGPYLIAEKLQTPVVFYFATREGRRTYRFHFVNVAPQIEGRRDGRRCFEKFVEELEREVTRRPEQWFNFYNFWNA